MSALMAFVEKGGVYRHPENYRPHLNPQSASANIDCSFSDSTANCECCSLSPRAYYVPRDLNMAGLSHDDGLILDKHVLAAAGRSTNNRSYMLLVST